MNEILQTLLHADRDSLLLVLGIFTSLGGVVGYIAKQLVTAYAVGYRAREEAAARKVVLDAEGAKEEKENTGRFVQLATADRKQIDDLFTELRSALKQCHEEREADRKSYEEDRKASEAEIGILKDRVSELESSRDALWDELKAFHDSVNSGGAYPAPLRSVK
jgi:vacuolar-type H+-ATPase subunit I/STV1